ncbi:hypothetical protein WN944_025609 [Citrus x changshan-huyou]|uniref:Uncharacterized protein n=1 Tax=Citrus x changshan-huyou TaxID=2935761 RepID=A0AAP0QD43_9ROSI
MDLTIYFLYKLWLGVDSTLGAGAYILVGTVAREHSGPALTLSFPYSWNSFCFFSLLLCRACKSLAICWECLSLFIHMCWRRVVDWLALILEYTIGGSAVPRGIYPNLVWLCILPFFLAHQEIPGLDIIVDPCAAIIVLFVTGLLCVGIKESSIDSVSLQFSQSSLAISGENLVDVGTLK